MNLINVVASGDHIPFLTPVRPTGDLFEMALEYSCQTTELNPALPAHSTVMLPYQQISERKTKQNVLLQCSA